MLIEEKRSASMPSCDNVVTCWSQGLEKKTKKEPHANASCVCSMYGNWFNVELKDT